MGVFSFLFKKKSEDVENISKINDTLKSSFSNVKTDILHLHKNLSDHTSHTHGRFQEMEDRIKRIELILMNNKPQQAIKILEQRELIKEEETTPDVDVINV